MEITLTDLTDNHKKINVTISKDEYLQERKKSIKKYQKSAIVPGFRPGTAPESLILKLYGNNLGINEIYEKAYSAFQNEISKKQIKPLLEPIAGFHTESNFVTGENIQVEFEIGIEPEIAFDLTEITEENLFKVELTEEELEGEIQRLLSENKNISEVQDETEAHAFEINISVIDDNHQNNDTKDEVIVIRKEDISEDRYQEFLQNLKSGNTKVNLLDFVVNPEDEKYSKLKTSNRFAYGRMIRYDNIQLDELPEKIFPGKSFESQEEFKSYLKDQIEQHFNTYNQNVFIEKILEKLIQRVQNLPIEFISKWWISRENSADSQPFDQVKPYIIRELSIQLVHNKLSEVLGIRISKDDVISHFTILYGKSIPEEQSDAMIPVIQNYIINELSDSEKAKKMFEKTYEEMLKSKILELKTNPYKITFSQMKEILSNSNQ